MEVIDTAITDVKILKPRLYRDARGYFMESYNKKTFASLTGVDVEFVQDNYSRSTRGVLRGLHYQIRQTQGKLVRVIAGEVYDVAVDLRRSSPTFAQWTGVRLTAGSHEQLWIPAGFAHGFVVLSETADFLYKVTDYYAPQYECAIRWNDPDLNIDWQFDGQPLVSEKDEQAVLLTDAEIFD